MRCDGILCDVDKKTHLPVGLGAKRILGAHCSTFFPFKGNTTSATLSLIAGSPSIAPTFKGRPLETPVVRGLMVKALMVRTC